MKRRNRNRNNLVLIVPPCDGNCSCKRFLVDCAHRLANEDTVWYLSELSALEDMLYVDLSCVAYRCIDLEFRSYAIAQLNNPHWDEQKLRDKFRLQ
jgi:hypothetical protein